MNHQHDRLQPDPAAGAPPPGAPSNAAPTLRQRSEDLAREKSASPVPATGAMTPEEAQQALHELHVHQIELEMQNEELRVARKQADTALGRYIDLFNTAPVGYVTINPAGLLLEINHTAATLLGLARHQMVDRPMSRFIHKDDQDIYYLHHKRLLANHEPQMCELRLLTHDRRLLWVRLDFSITPGMDRLPVSRVVLSDITGRKQAAEEIKASLAEKEVLLREIHHRVKNNLQVISSLVSLQADSLAEPKAREALIDLRGRIHSMALIHEKLYQTGNLAQLNFADYAATLLRYLWHAHGTLADQARLDLAIKPVTLPVDAAVPCGLILNELVANSLKHAFPDGRGGTVTVALELDPAAESVCLRVADDGVGFPADLNWRQARSLGLRLVQILSRQLGGTVDLGDGPGTEFRVTFPARVLCH